MGLMKRRRQYAITIGLLLSFLIFVVDGAKYAKTCELQSSPPVTLEYDTATGQYTLIESIDPTHMTYNDEVSTADDSDENRMLTDTSYAHYSAVTTHKDENQERGYKDKGIRVLKPGIFHKEGSIHVGNHLLSEGINFLRANNRHVRLLESESNHSSSSTTTKKTFIARSCPCDTDKRTYCLVDGITGPVPDSCGVPWADNLSTLLFSDNSNSSDSIIYNTEDIGCFELNSQTVFIRNAWPVVVLWYGALFVFLLATSNGKYARAYVFNFLTNGRQVNRQVDRMLARENEMRARLRAAAVRAAALANGPGRFLVRTPGIRIPSRGDRRRDGLSIEEERQEATRWWIQQAEHFGILSSPHQEVQYVLRTKTFNTEKERARREEIRRMMKNAEQAKDLEVGKDAELYLEDSSSSLSNVTTPKRRNTNLDNEEGPATPETVATTLTADTSFSSDPINDANDEKMLEEVTSFDVPGNSCAEEEDDDTFECTICLTEVDDGEKVGMLSCPHIFHADCLKLWVARRNACPLCQVAIASPRPVEVSSVIIDQGSSDEDMTASTSDRNVPSSNEEGEENNNNSETTGGENTPSLDTTPWYRPVFLFPSSDTQTERAPSTQTSLSLTDNERRMALHNRSQHQRRRRRARQSDMW